MHCLFVVGRLRHSDESRDHPDTAEQGDDDQDRVEDRGRLGHGNSLVGGAEPDKFHRIVSS